MNNLDNNNYNNKNNYKINNNKYKINKIQYIFLSASMFILLI